jgi:1-acyl-sn-glycerol-3-phosphate acyltransferase
MKQSHIVLWKVFICLPFLLVNYQKTANFAADSQYFMISIFRIIFLLLWSALMITSSLILMILTFNRKIPVIMARTMWSPGILWGAGVRNIKMGGLENIDKDKSYIFVSNHQSHLDIPSIIRSVPVNLYFIAKKELKWVPFLGQYVWATGMIFIDRSNRKKAIQSLDQAGKLIKKGKSVLAFPEGTRSLDGALQRFKKGPFMLSIQHDIEIIPIAVEDTYKVLPSKGWRFTPHNVKVTLGKPIKPTKDKQNVTELMNKVSLEIGEMMGSAS